MCILNIFESYLSDYSYFPFTWYFSVLCTLLRDILHFKVLLTCEVYMYVPMCEDGFMCMIPWRMMVLLDLDEDPYSYIFEP